MLETIKESYNNNYDALIHELMMCWHHGPHPSAVEQRKEDNWEKRLPFLAAVYGSNFLLTVAAKAAAAANALPTTGPLPSYPVETEEQRNWLRQIKVFGNAVIVKLIAEFIPDLEVYNRVKPT